VRGGCGSRVSVVCVMCMDEVTCSTWDSSLSVLPLTLSLGCTAVPVNAKHVAVCSVSEVARSDRIMGDILYAFSGFAWVS
jgi:hypothetical protein